MKPYLVAFFLILACGTSIVGWFYFANKIQAPEAVTPINTTKETYIDKKKAEQETLEQDIQLYNRAISGKNIALCQKIIDPTRKQKCEDTIQAMKAIAANDITLCDAIRTPEILTECKNRLTRKIAEDAGDKTLCTTIDETNDQAYCRENIDAVKLKNTLENGTLSSDFCRSLEVKFQEECSVSLAQKATQLSITNAVRTGDSSSCDLIPLESERVMCMDTISLRKAMTEGNITLCESISDDEKRAYCKKMLTKNDEAHLFREYIASNNLNGCQSLTETTLKNKCNDNVILSLVRINKNSTLCKELINTGITTSCQKLAE